MKRKTLSLLLALALLLSLSVPVLAAEEPVIAPAPDALSIANAKTAEFTVKLDGKDLGITMYEDEYVANPTTVAGANGFARDGVNFVDQGISIYVPETATADSPVYFMVNNSGWQSDSYSARTQIYPEGTEIQGRNGVTIGGIYDTASSNVGAALARGMVVVSYGCRSRNDKADADGNYVGHSPATMTDTKAVLRYLRYNAAALGVGDMDKIIITGTSGGGALSVVIAASGNSADYYESLYEIGAAGIVKNADGSYTSTINDDVFGTVAYCPINDLREADQAYEWTYNTARKTLVENGKSWSFNDEDVTEKVLAASDVLAKAYPEYVASLNIPYGDGILNADNMEQAMLTLLNAELADTLAEGATYESMKADVEAAFEGADAGWLVRNADGTVVIGDLQAYLVWLGTKQALKAAPAFSNVGMQIAGQNEDSLFGTAEYQYSAYEFYSWDNDITADNGCGKDDSGLTWDEFMATPEGKALALQGKMSSPIDYLTVDAANADSAPYWYVRHGMADRDTSFGLQSTLYYAMAACSDIKDLNFEFAWLKAHSGNYDVPEAFAWLDGILGTAPIAAEEEAPAVVLSPQNLTLNGAAVDCEKYNINGSNFFKLRDIAMMLKGTAAEFAVDFNTEKYEVYVTTGEAYVPVGGELTVGADKSASCVRSSWTVYVDGVKANVLGYNLAGNNFFKLRDLGAALGFDVDYIEATNTAVIEAPYTLNFADASKTALNVTVDGEALAVDWYVDCYVASPNRAADQKINVYVPAGAAKDAPIMFYVNNSGWQANTYPANTVTDGGAYVSGANDKVGEALANGYVIVSYGCRSRNNGQTDGKYLGHSPATMTDTKAAIRYLRYNKDALPAGDVEKIVVTGTSGGGALSTVIAASGNSPDYFESLYEVGAAGIVKNADGTYSSVAGCGDNVFAVIGYCPITDFAQADAGYEWTYNDTREALYAAGKMDYGTATEEIVMAASDELAAIYAEYVNGLGLKDESGAVITADNLAAHIAALMEKEIAESVEEIGIEQMEKDVAKDITQGRGADAKVIGQRENNGWIVFNEDGSFTYDYVKHLLYVAAYTDLKPAPSFSNQGISAYAGQRNEDNLFGSVADDYSPFNAVSWALDDTPNAVGQDDTGLTWDEFMATDAGKALALEIKMTNAVAYLVEGKADTAPHWYFRHGMDDRDTSFAVETVLYYSALNNSQIEDLDFEFAWLKPHSGDYDVQEAYAWLAGVIK